MVGRVRVLGLGAVCAAAVAVSVACGKSKGSPDDVTAGPRDVGPDASAVPTGDASVSPTDAADPRDAASSVPCEERPPACARDVDGKCFERENGCLDDGWSREDCSAFGCPGETHVAEVPGCDLEDVMDYVVGSASVVDCGSITSTSTSSEIVAAQTCLDGAIASGGPYRADWELSGTDSSLREGSLRVAEGDGELAAYDFRYDSLGVWPNGAQSWWSRCTDVAVATTCPDGSTLCVDCTEGDVACECREASPGQGPGYIYCDGPPSVTVPSSGGIDAGAGCVASVPGSEMTIDGVRRPDGHVTICTSSSYYIGHIDRLTLTVTWRYDDPGRTGEEDEVTVVVGTTMPPFVPGPDGDTLTYPDDFEGFEHGVQIRHVSAAGETVLAPTAGVLSLRTLPGATYGQLLGDLWFSAALADGGAPASVLVRAPIDTPGL